MSEMRDFGGGEWVCGGGDEAEVATLVVEEHVDDSQDRSFIEGGRLEGIKER